MQLVDKHIERTKRYRGRPDAAIKNHKKTNTIVLLYIYILSTQGNVTGIVITIAQISLDNCHISKSSKCDTLS